jgi:hypothetical protein
MESGGPYDRLRIQGAKRVTRTIPFPDLTRRYVELTKLPSEKRLREAEQATVHEFAGLICESIDAFREFDVKPDEPFYPANDARDSKKSHKQKGRTFGWAMAIKNMRAAIRVDGDESLAFRYVAREVTPVHTKPLGEFSPADAQLDPRTKPQVNSTDLILINEHSARPTVAELKIGPDKEPFTALVQALAAAAQLVPAHQRARLHELDHRLTTFDQDPLIDVFVLLAAFPASNRHRWHQLAYARGLAAGLEIHPDVRKYFGRVTFLQLHRSDDDGVRADTALPTPAH